MMRTRVSLSERHQTWGMGLLLGGIVGIVLFIALDSLAVALGVGVGLVFFTRFVIGRRRENL